MSKGKLKLEDYKCIQSNYCFLKDNIEAKDLVDYLFEKDVISLDDKEKISGGRAKSERNELFLNILLNAGPGEAFRNFLKSLEKKYKFVLVHFGLAGNLETEHKQLHTMKDSLEREAEQLKSIKGALKKENRRLKRENGALKKENKGLKYKNAKEHKSTETLQKEAVVLKDKIAKGKSQRDLRQLNDELDTANCLIEILVNEIRSLSEEKARGTAEMGYQNKEISRLKRQHAMDLEERNILHEEIQSFKREQDETLAVLEFYKKILSQKDYENVTVVNDFLSLNEEKSRALDCVDKSKREIQRLTEELAKLNERHEADRVEIERLHMEVDQIDPLKDQLAKFLNCVEEKDREIGLLSEQIDKWKELCKSQRSRINKFQMSGREENIELLPMNQLCKHCRERKIDTLAFEGVSSIMDVKLIKWENFSLSGHFSKSYQ